MQTTRSSDAGRRLDAAITTLNAKMRQESAYHRRVDSLNPAWFSDLPPLRVHERPSANGQLTVQRYLNNLRRMYNAFPP